MRSSHSGLLKSAEPARDARALALRALLHDGTQAALDQVLREPEGKAGVRIDNRERALATQLTYGTVKMRRALIWSLQHYLRKPFDGMDAALQNVLLLGAFQLLYLKKIPAHSAVDESVKLARRYGHAGTAAVANAVLRKLSSQPLRPPPPEDASQLEVFADFASVPNWIAQHWIDRFGFATALQIAEGVNQQARRALRVNTTRVSVAAMSAELAAKNVSVRAGVYGIPECLVLEERAPDPVEYAVKSAPLQSTIAQAIRLGLVTVQSEESQLAVQLLQPGSSATIADVCAGRGVKAGAIGERLSAASRLFALDDDGAKLALLAAEFQRLGLKRPHIVRGDARQPYPASMPTDADAVLVDVPCSGIGTIGRRAELRWTKEAHDPQRLGHTQLAILDRAASIVREGGRLLYAVCSTAVAENEDVVGAFLARNPQWRSAPLALDGHSTAVDKLPHTVKKLGDFALTVPGIDGADGFFYALLIRRSATPEQALP